MPSTQAKIAIALALTVLAVFGFLWQIANIRGLRARGRKRGRDSDAKSQQRKSDSRDLRGAEKRLYNESQKLLAQNKIAAAARILEQLNMPREAIQALEDHGMIHEAAKILMRMQRHNRAGVIYARHGLWENAAQCFKLANMPVEVAKCAREGGDLAMAAEYFDKASRPEDAGECHEQLGNLQKAARSFAVAGKRARAMALYDRLATGADDLSALTFEDQEIDQIVEHLAEGSLETGLVALVVNRHRLTSVILHLVGNGVVKQASELLRRATSDVGPKLMAEVDYETRAASCLAEAFIGDSQFQYAGMVFERMAAFERAGEAFERAENFERAAYCFERAGLDFKVKPLKEKARAKPYAAHRGARDKDPGGFALANVQTASNSSVVDEEAAADESLDGDEEKTAMVNVREVEAAAAAAAAAAPATSLPPPPCRQEFSPAPTLTPAPASTTGPSANFSLSALEEDDEPAAAPAPTPATAVEPMVQSPATNEGTGTVATVETPATPETPAGSSDRLEDGRAAFHRAAFFADLDLEQKSKLWEIGTTLDFVADQSVLTYNDEPKGVYVIVQGSVSCYRLVGGKEAYVDQMGASESFGELWLLADQPTAVRFVAAKNTKIRVIDRSAFNDLLDRDGMIARKLYKRFTMRLLKRLLKPAPPPPVAAVPPLPGRGQQAS